VAQILGTGCISWQPTNSVKALKEVLTVSVTVINWLVS